MDHEMADQILQQKFSLLVHQHQTSLMKICYLYLQDLTLAEDAVQETFMKAYRSYQRFRGESKEKTWLIRIAINTCKDINRSSWNRHINRLVTPDMLPVSHEPFEKQDEDLVLIIMNLPPKLKEVILLYYYQDLNIREIASLLHISPPAVSSRISRAKRIIRSFLEGSEKYE